MDQPPTAATALAPEHAQPAGLVASGRRVLEIEGQALAAVGARIDGDFARACQLALAGVFVLWLALQLLAPIWG